MPSINFVSPLLGVDGNILLDADTKTPILLKTVAINALMSAKQGEQLSGTEQVSRFNLARKISANAELNLTVEQVALLKRQLSTTYNTLVAASAMEQLDPQVDA